MSRTLWPILSAAVLLTGCVSAQPIRTYEELKPLPLTGKSRTILVKRVVSTIEKGAQIGTIQAGLGCAGSRKLLWTQTGQLAGNAERSYGDRIREELVKAGYTIVGSPSDAASLSGRALFEEPSVNADFLLAAIIKHVAWNMCYPYAGFGSGKSKGEASIEVEWQLYDNQAKDVLLTATTGGAAQTDTADQGASQALWDALGVALRNLLADNRFVFYVTAHGQ